MVAGRPRTTSFSPEEMIELGKEMVAWVEENEPLHLKQWYSIEKMFLYEEWKAFIRKPEFVPYYEQALSLVSLQYLDKNSTIRDSIANRFLRVYFKDAKESEDEEAQFNSDLRKKENDASRIPDDYVKEFNKHMNAILGAQSSALKSSETSNITDNKS